MFGGDGAGVPQCMGEQGAVRPAPGTPGHQTHRPALGQTGGVQGGGLGTGQPLGQGQLPGAGDRKKGGELCFHILAACVGQLIVLQDLPCLL